MSLRSVCCIVNSFFWDSLISFRNASLGDEILEERHVSPSCTPGKVIEKLKILQYGNSHTRNNKFYVINTVHRTKYVELESLKFGKLIFQKITFKIPKVKLHHHSECGSEVRLPTHTLVVGDLRSAICFYLISCTERLFSDTSRTGKEKRVRSILTKCDILKVFNLRQSEEKIESFERWEERGKSSTLIHSDWFSTKRHFYKELTVE